MKLKKTFVTLQKMFLCIRCSFSNPQCLFEDIDLTIFEVNNGKVFLKQENLGRLLMVFWTPGSIRGLVCPCVRL